MKKYNIDIISPKNNQKAIVLYVFVYHKIYTYINLST